MIIVSQDKEHIYNFDNVKSIDVVENEVYITDDILANAGTLIGVYETEERAKEVLQEIVTASTIKQLNGKKVSKEEFDMYIKSMQYNVYEMPKN